MSERDDDLTPAERRALDLWRAPEPPDDFQARVLAAVATESRPRAFRQVAVAALAVMLVGGFFAARLLTGGTSPLGEVHLDPGDGGPTVEASPNGDGVRS